MSNENTITERILDYLQQQPEAGDTLEGIATWWLQRQHVQESVNAVQAALHQLKQEGLIGERKTPDGRTLHFLRKLEDHSLGSQGDGEVFVDGTSTHE